MTWLYILMGWIALILIPLLKPGLLLNHYEDVDKDWP